MALVKKVEIDLSVSGDAATKAKLDAITARAEELKKAFPEFKVKISTQEAAAKLAVFRADMALTAKSAGTQTGTMSSKFDALGKSIQKAADKMKAGGGPGWLGPALVGLPAVTRLLGVAAGAAIGLGGAFVAGAGALAGFGAVAKPVLSDALTASQQVSAAQDAYTAALKAGGGTQVAAATRTQAIATAQSNYNIAIAGGAKPAAALKTEQAAIARAQAAYGSALKSGVPAAQAYKAEQLAIAKAYAGLSPQQITLSKQLGVMADAWDDVKASFTPLIAGSLQPWLAGITAGVGLLGLVIKPMVPAVTALGVQFNLLVSSDAFKTFIRWVGTTGSAVVSSAGSAVLNLIAGLVALLPQFTPLITGASNGVEKWSLAFAHWASSKKAADQIQAFLGWFHDNGPQVHLLLLNLGGALKALAPGLAPAGALELRVISDFFGAVAKLPPSIAKPLLLVAGALLTLNKLGVFSVGVKLIGVTAGWVKKLISGATVDLGAAGMQRAGDTMVAAAGQMQRAADTMAGGSAAGGAGKAEGAAGGAAGLLSGLSAAAVAGGAAIAAGLILRAREDIKHGFPLIVSDIGRLFSGSSGFLAVSASGWADAIIGHFEKPLRAMDDRIGHAFVSTFDQIRHDIAAKWDQIWADTRAKVTAGAHYVETQFDSQRHVVFARVDGMRHDIATAWDTIWRNTISRIQNGIAAAVAWFAGMPHRLLTQLSGLGDSLNSFAANALHLFLEGFEHEAGGILSWVANFAKGILGKLGSLFGIHSPSSVMYDMGKNLVLGLEAGIKDHAQKAATALAGAVVPNVGSGVARWTGTVEQALAMEGLSKGADPPGAVPDQHRVGRQPQCDQPDRYQRADG